MAYKKDIIEAIQKVIKNYPNGVSDEHLFAIIELYADRELRPFKGLVVNELKDLQEQSQISKQDIQKVINKVLNYKITA